jgi:hypothetical protein
VACALRGADETAAYIERKLGCAPGSTTADGAFTWDATIECLGACGYAPMMQIDHHFHENLTPDKIDHILETVAAQPGPHEAHQTPSPRAGAPTGETPPPPTAEGPPARTNGRPGGGGGGKGGARRPGGSFH